MSDLPHRATRASIAMAVLAALVWATAIAAQQPADAESTLVARLAVVEPAASRISVLVEGEVTLRDLHVAPDAEITQGDRKLTMADLVIEVGRRVTIRVRPQPEQRVAVAISVEPAQ